MPLKTGNNPAQYGLFATPIEAMIAEDNEVRVIAAFADRLDLPALGFKKVGKTGAGAYGPRVLLKIYLYGYLNRIRSSRTLSRECGRNIELFWLTGNLQPAYHTIADFRKDHAPALKQVFREFVLLCKSWNLIGGEVLAVDGTKIRGQNAMKNNYTEKKLDRHLAYIEQQVEQALDEFEEADRNEQSTQPEGLEALGEVLECLDKRRDKYENLKKQLQKSGQTQVSTTDTDVRALPLKRNIVEVGYNVQSVVDSRHKLIVSTEVTNESDINALGRATITACNDLGLHYEDQVKVLADKGYHNAAELAYLQENNIETYVAERDQSGSQPKAEGFRKDNFEYDAELDSYTCPQGKQLTTNGTLYSKPNARGGTAYRFKRYTSSYTVCWACPKRDQCLSDTAKKYRHGRYLERNEHQEALDNNRQNLKKDPDLYKQRQAIVEHPFGTIKRSWGDTYTLLKGKEKVNGEWALIHLCYNLRRSVSLLGVTGLIRALKAENDGFFDFLRLGAVVTQEIRAFCSDFWWCMRLVGDKKKLSLSVAGCVFAQTDG
ncbi:MAG: IS1182 family transposase [Saprospiraceae bacterium]|nr:IS1182 family transposase [Saprospiraceae bacterium]